MLFRFTAIFICFVSLQNLAVDKDQQPTEEQKLAEQKRLIKDREFEEMLELPGTEKYNNPDFCRWLIRKSNECGYIPGYAGNHVFYCTNTSSNSNYATNTVNLILLGNAGRSHMDF